MIVTKKVTIGSLNTWAAYAVRDLLPAPAMGLVRNILMITLEYHSTTPDSSTHTFSYAINNGSANSEVMITGNRVFDITGITLPLVYDAFRGVKISTTQALKTYSNATWTDSNGTIDFYIVYEDVTPS
jgi:hypothetical protein